MPAFGQMKIDGVIPISPKTVRLKKYFLQFPVAIIIEEKETSY